MKLFSAQKAQKIGEEVGPSGGENGDPLSLAEDYNQAVFTTSITLFVISEFLGPVKNQIYNFF
jgi:hypothetical protein